MEYYIDGLEMSKIARATVAAVFVLGAAAFYWGHRSKAGRALLVGDRAPDFALPGLDRNTVSLANYRGQVVVLNFWATWCQPCVEEAPSLEKFSAEMQPLGVTVIGVSVDEDVAALQKFVADYRLSFPIARDPGGSLAAHFGTFKFPETYIIDRNGRVAEKIIGAIDWQDPQIVNFVHNLAPGNARAAK